MKRTWQKPEFKVIVRSTPEEAVLANCKTRRVSNYCYKWYGRTHRIGRS